MKSERSWRERLLHSCLYKVQTCFCFHPNADDRTPTAIKIRQITAWILIKATRQTMHLFLWGFGVWKAVHSWCCHKSRLLTTHVFRLIGSLNMRLTRTTNRDRLQYISEMPTQFQLEWPSRLRWCPLSRSNGIQSRQRGLSHSHRHICSPCSCICKPEIETIRIERHSHEHPTTCPLYYYYY